MQIKHTGFLFELKPSDFILGVASPIKKVELLSSGDFKKYQPKGEKQYKQATFDTFSCTSFSFANIIETFVNYFVEHDYFTIGQLEKMNTLGFFADGKFNISDRALAIMSGTMPTGNYFQNVGDAVRKQGLLPDALLPFGGNNQTEYLNKALITPELQKKAKEILDILDISYEWLALTQDQLKLIPENLKYGPLWAAIPIPGTHAVEIIAPGEYFDSYEPYIKSLNGISYVMVVNVSVKKYEQKYKYFNTKSDPKMIGIKDELMKIVDTMRGECGFPFIITSGYRTPAYNATLKDSVSDSAHCTGEAIDLACTDSTKRMKIISSAIKNGITRVGVSSSFIHLDIAKDKPQGVMWTY